MEPIISPWFFYLIDVVPSLSGVFIWVSVIILTLWLLVNMTSEGEFLSDFPKTNVALILIGCTFWVPAVFIPSKEALIQMAVASQLTGDNINTILDVGKALKDEAKGDIIEVIDKLKE